MKIRLVSTKLGSQSLKRLAQGLSTKLGYKVWRSAKPLSSRLNLKYGDQKDKIAQYSFFQNSGINALEFTTSKQEAMEWEGTVVCRTLTKASEGKGIVIAESPDEIINAPVYTKYKKKKKEFRVHILRDTVVCVLEKRRKKGTVGDTKVRNTANGYVFCSQDVIEPKGIRELALAASKVTTSDFKGVDIGWNEKKQELFVIEVNSAPGIEGSNVDKYVSAIVQGV